MKASDAQICVLGAGIIGRRIAAELARAAVPYRFASRAVRSGDGVIEADAFDSTALAAAFAGTRVVINAAGPLRETAAPVLTAALAAGAHYVDVGGEQATLQALYERHESTVRRAGLIALPGAGLDCVLGDLAAAWAAQHLCGVEDPGEAIRSAPATRLAEDRPLDEVAVSYVFDDLVLSAGSQRALFGSVGARAMVWRRDRWEPGRAGDKRRVNAGAAMGGERDAIAHPAGDVITIPRYLAANLVASYVSTTRDPASGMLLRLLSTAASMLPKAAQGVLAPFAPPEEALSRARFSVIAQVRPRLLGGAALGARRRPVPHHGRDRHVVCASARHPWPGPVGMRAPAELFRAEPALREIASAAELTIEPSWGA